ncbi:MAG: DUF3082 domain-containing protein [Synechococcaceae cyanobacterium]|nr:DUF3082 domain-containing protein [Synechococcaceae cyanobacterium]
MSEPNPRPSAGPADSGDDGLPAPEPQPKGPLSFLSGALTSGLLAWLALGLSRRVVTYYNAHPPRYEAAVAQSIATALKTLLVGMCFLATFSFAFIGLGLFVVFLRSLLPAGTSPRS